MNTGLRRANLGKRFVAYILDLILLACLMAAVGWGVSSLLDYQGYNDQLNAVYERYSQEYGVELPTDSVTYEAMVAREEDSCTPEEWEERNNYMAAIEAINNDDEAYALDITLLAITLLTVVTAVLFACAVLELTVPLLFGNGQTLGKKLLGLMVIRIDGSEVSRGTMVLRAILGKGVIETLLPASLVVALSSGSWTFLVVSAILAGVILMLQVSFLCATRHRFAIHDMVAQTVVVDPNAKAKENMGLGRLPRR